jgi:hypothetical protein
MPFKYLPYDILNAIVNYGIIDLWETVYFYDYLIALDFPTARRVLCTVRKTCAPQTGIT